MEFQKALSLLFCPRDPAKAFKYSNLLVSGRFRKVSGSLSGSLHANLIFVAVPEGSGRFPEGCPEACLVFVQKAAVPEACPEACWTASIYCIPEGSGRFPEVLPEAVQNIELCFWRSQVRQVRNLSCHNTISVGALHVSKLSCRSLS